MTPILECYTTLEGHSDKVWDVKWNPTGTLLASCSTDKTIRIWGKEGLFMNYTYIARHGRKWI